MLNFRSFLVLINKYDFGVFMPPYIKKKKKNAIYG